MVFYVEKYDAAKTGNKGGCVEESVGDLSIVGRGGFGGEPTKDLLRIWFPECDHNGSFGVKITSR
jgi:hypothetical protein